METSANSDEVLKISVVMATYNGGRYLAEQLDSIVAQTYPVVEVIVQDDGSTDNTLEVAEDYARRYPLIKVFTNDSGRHGVNGNFFSAMRRAKGDYIAIADQDDIWEKEKLQVQAEAIGDKMLATGFSVPFSSEGFPVKADLRRPNLHLIRNTYLSQVPGHTMLFDRKILDFIDESPQMPLYYDWQIACVASAAESIVFVDRKLVNFRRHASAATAFLPVGHSLMSGRAFDYFWVSLVRHGALQREVRERFKIVLPFLERLPFNTRSLGEAIKMSRLQIRRGLPAFLGRMVFFVRHSHHIFHAEERRVVVRYLRALFFVFSCGYYYRSHLKKS